MSSTSLVRSLAKERSRDATLNYSFRSVTEVREFIHTVQADVDELDSHLSFYEDEMSSNTQPVLANVGSGENSGLFNDHYIMLGSLQDYYDAMKALEKRKEQLNSTKVQVEHWLPKNKGRDEAVSEIENVESRVIDKLSQCLVFASKLSSDYTPDKVVRDTELISSNILGLLDNQYSDYDWFFLAHAGVDCTVFTKYMDLMNLKNRYGYEFTDYYIAVSSAVYFDMSVTDHVALLAGFRMPEFDLGSEVSGDPEELRSILNVDDLIAES